MAASVARWTGTAQDKPPLRREMAELPKAEQQRAKDHMEQEYEVAAEDDKEVWHEGAGFEAGGSVASNPYSGCDHETGWDYEEQIEEEAEQAAELAPQHAKKAATSHAKKGDCIPCQEGGCVPCQEGGRVPCQY